MLVGRLYSEVLSMASCQSGWMDGWMDEVVHGVCSASSIIQYFLNDGTQEELIKPFR